VLDTGDLSMQCGATPGDAPLPSQTDAEAWRQRRFPAQSHTRTVEAGLLLPELADATPARHRQRLELAELFTACLAGLRQFPS
jgi:hypothetical protein